MREGVTRYNERPSDCLSGTEDPFVLRTRVGLWVALAAALVVAVVGMGASTSSADAYAYGDPVLAYDSDVDIAPTPIVAAEHSSGRRAGEDGLAAQFNATSAAVGRDLELSPVLVAPTSALDDAVRLGNEGELLSGIVKNTERIPSASGTAAYRIPDGLDRTAGLLQEVKNVNSLSYTTQLRDFSSFAQANGYRFELFVRPTTQLSGPLQTAVSNGDIVLRFLPG